MLITGAGPIGLMAAAVARHAGARYVVITDVNPYRLELARKMGVTVALDVREGSLAETQANLGMKEGFDVGLEMSGNPAALRDMVENLSHGASIALLGLPEEPFAIDWNTVIFDQLTIRGVYGREMYETWYMMTVMLQSGLDIAPVITHRFPAERFEDAFAAIRSRRDRQGAPVLGRGSVTSETVRPALAAELEEIRGAGLEKPERVLASAQGARVGVRGPRGRGPQPLREQLPRARRPPRGRSRPRTPRWRSGASGSRRCASSAGRRRSTRSSRPRSSAFLGTGGHDPLLVAASTPTAGCSRRSSASRTR